MTLCCGHFRRARFHSPCFEYRRSRYEISGISENGGCLRIKACSRDFLQRSSVCLEMECGHRDASLAPFNGDM